MKLAGLMPYRPDARKSRIGRALEDMARVCAEIIVLHDRPHSLPTPALPRGVTEEVWITNNDSVWNDYSNRATLLARAAKYGCDWAMWLDDDETLGSDMTAARVGEICQDADLNQAVTVMVRVKTMWDEFHWRCDGVFGRQWKHFFQRNPFMIKNPQFEHGPADLLHNFPTLEGKRHNVSAHILHWGMVTRELREANVEKYHKADPGAKFTDIPYNYLLDETGIHLKKINEPFA